MDPSFSTTTPNSMEPWNKGVLVGQKLPLRLGEIWAIRVRLQLCQRTRELALFNLAIDSKCGPAIWCGSASRMFAMADVSHPVRS